MRVRRDSIKALWAAAAALVIGVAGCSSSPSGPPAGTVYLMVSEMSPATGDSYILPLADDAAIAHARALIRDPSAELPKIVVARIARGSGDGTYVNRDLLQGGRDWSWHVTQFVGFADVTAEILDGNPSLVEADVEGWIANTGGLVGFWGYTVTREVPAEKVQP